MRNLTIERRKSVVGSLAKMKVYIEDATVNELTINGIPCRKLGELKNNETKTFEIDTPAATLFVIAGKTSTSFCNECYALPEGEKDIALSGQNRFNPAAGNAFRFDNNDTADSVQNRKRTTRKGVIVLCIALVVGFVGGYLLSSGLLNPRSTTPKTFTVEELSVTLTEEFREHDAEGFNAVFEGRQAAVVVLKEPFSLAEGLDAFSLETYTELVSSVDGLAVAPHPVGDALCFEYSGIDDETKDVYYFVAYTYKTDDAFWLIQFGTEMRYAEEYAEQIAEWASTITFAA